MTAVVDLAEVAADLTRGGIPAVVFNSGGNVATVGVGAADAGTREHPILVGPGWTSEDVDDAVAYLADAAELCAGYSDESRDSEGRTFTSVAAAEAHTAVVAAVRELWAHR